MGPTGAVARSWPASCRAPGPGRARGRTGTQRVGARRAPWRAPGARRDDQKGAASPAQHGHGSLHRRAPRRPRASVTGQRGSSPGPPRSSPHALEHHRCSHRWPSVVARASGACGSFSGLAARAIRPTTRALPARRGRKGACSDAGLPHRRTSPGRRAGVARRRPGRAHARRPGGVGAGGLRGRAGSSGPSAGSQRAAAGPEASGARCRHERPIDDEKRRRLSALLTAA